MAERKNVGEKKEVVYPVTEERLMIWDNNARFFDFELDTQVRRLTDSMRKAQIEFAKSVEELTHLQNLVYWHTKDPDDE